MLNRCDGLVVIGTALQTAFAKRIVTACIEMIDVPIIEVNLESCIDYGYTIKLCQKSEVCLPEMF